MLFSFIMHTSWESTTCGTEGTGRLHQLAAWWKAAMVGTQYLFTVKIRLSRRPPCWNLALEWWPRGTSEVPLSVLNSLLSTRVPRQPTVWCAAEWGPSLVTLNEKSGEQSIHKESECSEQGVAGGKGSRARGQRVPLGQGSQRRTV